MRSVVGAVSLAVILLLAACGGGNAVPTLAPTPTTTPLFASEEEALAAAEEAYAAYLAMSGLISSEGGVEPERIAPFVTEERLVDELRGFETYRALGIRTEGNDTFRVLEIQRFDVAPGGVEIAIYVCWDASEVRVFDQDGTDVTPEDRDVNDLREIVLVAFNEQRRLVLESDTPWSSESC